jgi:hypothetical protein
MKPNLVIVQPSHIGMDSLIEQFCEDFCDSHYVYLVRPDSECREDSPGGVRFLNHPLDRLPRFGTVDAAIAVADHSVADRLKEFYPESYLAVWDPGDNSQLPDLIATLVTPKVVQGSFGEPEELDLAQAM